MAAIGDKAGVDATQKTTTIIGKILSQLHALKWAHFPSCESAPKPTHNQLSNASSNPGQEGRGHGTREQSSWQ